jgi:hypothetical protein
MTTRTTLSLLTFLGFANALFAADSINLFPLIPIARLTS